MQFHRHTYALLALPVVWLYACVLDREGTLADDPTTTTTNAGGSMMNATSSGGAGGDGGVIMSSGGAGGNGGVTTSMTTGGAGGSQMCDGNEDCADAMCVDADAGLLVPAETCGGGLCSNESAAPCPGGFKCASDACLTTCTNSSDCVSTHYCDQTSSTCAPKLPLGDPCPQGDECTTACIDGVCCDDACTGLCSSCVAADTGGTDGTCAPISAWSDPDSECTGGTELACDGAGACADCGEDVQAPGDINAPAICDSVNTVTNTCTIIANASEFDAQNPLNCPQNWHCNIDCSAEDSCRGTTITCPTDYACTIDCPSNDVCRDSLIVCPTNGTCDVTCGDDGCENGTIQCGTNQCSIDCVAGENKPPTINQGNACTLTEDCP